MTAFAVRGPSLALRLPRAADAPELFDLGRDPEVTRFFSWGPYTEEAQAAAWLETLPTRREHDGALELAIADGDDRLVGITLLAELDARDRRGVVGTWLGRGYWGTGANFESKALVAHLAFRDLGLLRLGAYADVRNARSRAALEKIGFAFEGTLREFHRHGEAPRDVTVYSLLRAEWEAGPLAGVAAMTEGEVPPGVLRRAGQ